jgi:hypothetical protein
MKIAGTTADVGSQSVVVTGASGGIGRATSMAFGARGAPVGLLARGEKGLLAAARGSSSTARVLGGWHSGTLAANAIAAGLAWRDWRPQNIGNNCIRP